MSWVCGVGLRWCCEELEWCGGDVVARSSMVLMLWSGVVVILWRGVQGCGGVAERVRAWGDIVARSSRELRVELWSGEV